MTVLPQRQELVAMTHAARSASARLEPACAEMSISLRMLQRWVVGEDILADGRPTATRPPPSCKLSAEERRAVLATCMEPRFADLPPTQIAPILADEGNDVGSESTLYRVLHDHRAQHHRGRQRRRNRKPAPMHVARRANQIWCWDIAYLPSTVRGLFFYLYAVIDLYSRKIVAWEVHVRESGELAAELIERARWREKLVDPALILHADNGAAQRAFTLRAKLQDLGIASSYSRPGVSDDNAFIESWFRTLKYMPAWPSHGFAGLDQARRWVMTFIDWYNGQHRHREIGFVTPEQRHSGESTAVLARRRQVYEAARRRRPERWRSDTRRWSDPDHVWLNKRGKDKRVT